MAVIGIIQIVGLGLVATFLILILKEQKPAFAFLLAVCVGVMIFLVLIGQIDRIIHMLKQLATRSGLNMIYVETILKIIGIAYIAEFGAQLTRDAGQAAIASKIELAGKVFILLMAIPIITAVIQTVLGMLPK